MPSQEPAFPLSAVSLRLTDEVGRAVLDWVAAGDVALSAALDQHVAAVRAALVTCSPAELGSAWRAGQAAHQEAQSEQARSQAARSQAARSQAKRIDHARRSPGAARNDSARGPAEVRSAAAEISCPDTPFADSPWQIDTPLPLRLLLHYACGFIEAAVRADWWPGETRETEAEAEAEAETETAADAADFESVRLAAVCRLVRQAEAAAALPPDLR